MRVLQFGKFYFPHIGGIETFSYDLTESLNKMGVHTDVLCANKIFKTTDERFGSYRVVRTASLGKMASTAISPSMIKYLRKIWRDYDVIILHMPDPMANLAYSLIRPKAKLIVYWHADIVKQKNLLKLYHPLLIDLLKRADLILASSFSYAKYSKYLRMFNEKVGVIPLGINPDRLLGDREHEKLYLRDYRYGRKVVFSLGRLVYYKGFSFLIDAAKLLPSNYMIVIGGGGPLREELWAKIRKEKLDEKVYLAGEIPNEELENYYRFCDIFVLPSVERTEAFGLVQLEAMYYSKPVVATSIEGSGTAEIQENYVTGRIVPPKDPQALAEAIIEITENEYAYCRYASNAKERFERLYHINQVAENFIPLFKHGKSDT